MNARLVSRVGLVLLGVPGLLIAAWILLAPRSFYDDFPGFGNPWVSPDGPFNEHLLRDYGASQLALVVLTVCALVWFSKPLVVGTALAWFVASTPHLVYHVLNLEHFDSQDQIGITGSLAMPPVLAVVVLLAARGLGASETARPTAGP